MSLTLVLKSSDLEWIKSSKITFEINFFIQKNLNAALIEFHFFSFNLIRKPLQMNPQSCSKLSKLGRLDKSQIFFRFRTRLVLLNIYRLVL